MDERKRELKQEKRWLKKDYRREKWRCVLFWKTTSVLSFAVAAVSALAWAWLHFLDGKDLTAPQGQENGLLGKAVELINRCNPTRLVFFRTNPHSETVCLWAAGIAGLVLLCAAAMWIRGSRRLKLTEAALSYKAFKRERREEKKASKEALTESE